MPLRAFGHGTALCCASGQTNREERTQPAVPAIMARAIGRSCTSVMNVKIEQLTVKPILHAVQGTLRSRELTMIIGRSGSGKSTLLNVMAGLINPDTGHITYDDIPLWHNKKSNREAMLMNALAFQ